MSGVGNVWLRKCLAPLENGSSKFFGLNVDELENVSSAQKAIFRAELWLRKGNLCASASPIFAKKADFALSC
jgi:hypothetical protein